MNSPTVTFAKLSLQSPAIANENTHLHQSTNKRKRSNDNALSSPHNVSAPSTSFTQPALDSGLIRCICGYTEDDGLSIFCDMCGYWQHMSCVLGNPPPPSKDDSTTASDEDRNFSSDSSSPSSSKGKFVTPPTSMAAALPEQWFCERCVPRPVDASAARARQTRRIQADRERLLRAAGIIDQLPNGRKKSRSDNQDKRRRSTITGSQQNVTESLRRSKSGSATRKPTSSSNRDRSTSMDISPLDEDTMFEPWANEFVRICQDVIADEGVRQAIRRWRSSLECVVPSRDPLTPSSRSQLPPSISPITECLPLPSLPLNKIASIRLVVKQVPSSECQPTPMPVIASLPLPNVTPSYHDNSFHSSDPKSLSYGCPPTYGVYTANPTAGIIPTGSLLTTYVSRVIPVSTYTCAPLSQYTLLQLPKPHVRLIPPPLSLALDARELGNESRFIRNGCHPNAVIRPVISENNSACVEWGVYSTRSISAKGEEIVLGWEWDSRSPVQRLNDVLENGCVDVQDETNLKAEMCQILCTLGGTFTSCACGSGQKLSGASKCVFTLMSRFICSRSQFSPAGVSFKRATSESSNDTSVKNDNKPYLGPMLGVTGPSLVQRDTLMLKSASVSSPFSRNEISLPAPPTSPMASPSTIARPPSPATPPAKPRPLNSKSWASIVGLYDPPGPQPRSSASTTLPPSPAPSPTSHVTIHTIRMTTGTGGTGKTVQDRSNLPHTDASNSLPTPNSPSRPISMTEIPFPQSTRSPEAGLMRLPAVSVSVPRPPLGSPREWSTFTWGGRGKRSVSSPGVVESSGLGLSMDAEPTGGSMVNVDGGRDIDEAEEQNELVKLPPKMRKRKRSGTASSVEGPSNSFATGSVSPRELEDAALMPPPPLPASLDPTTVSSASSLSVSLSTLVPKTDERLLSPTSSYVITPDTPEREMSYDTPAMVSERSSETSQSPRVSVEPGLGTVIEDDVMEVENDDAEPTVVIPMTSMMDEKLVVVEEQEAAPVPATHGEESSGLVVLTSTREATPLPHVEDVSTSVPSVPTSISVAVTELAVATTDPVGPSSDSVRATVQASSPNHVAPSDAAEVPTPAPVPQYPPTQIPVSELESDPMHVPEVSVANSTPTVSTADPEPRTTLVPVVSPCPASTARMSFADWKKKRAAAGVVKQENEKEVATEESKKAEQEDDVIVKEEDAATVVPFQSPLAPVQAPSSPTTEPAVSWITEHPAKVSSKRSVDDAVVEVTPSMGGTPDATVCGVAAGREPSALNLSMGTSTMAVPTLSAPRGLVPPRESLPAVVKVEELSEGNTSEDDVMDIDSDSVPSTLPPRKGTGVALAASASPVTQAEVHNLIPIIHCNDRWAQSSSHAEGCVVVCTQDGKPKTPAWRLNSPLTPGLYDSPGWDESRWTQHSSSSSSRHLSVPTFQASDSEGAEDGEITSPPGKDTPLPEDDCYQSLPLKSDSPRSSTPSVVGTTRRPSPLSNRNEPPSPSHSKYNLVPRSRSLRQSSPSDSASVSSHSNHSPHPHQHTNGWFDERPNSVSSGNSWRDDSVWRSSSHHPYPPRDRDRDSDRDQRVYDRYRTREYDQERRWGWGHADDRARYDRERDWDRYGSSCEWDRRDYRELMKQREVDTRARDADIYKNNLHRTVGLRSPNT